MAGKLIRIATCAECPVQDCTTRADGPRPPMGCDLEDADKEVYSLRSQGKPLFTENEIVGVLGPGYTLHGRIRKVTHKDIVIRPVRRRG